jgi:hydrogenase maturation protease
VTRLVVFAWGNPSRGDDALGPEFLAAAEAMAPQPRSAAGGGEPGAGDGTPDIAYVTDFQLQPEHALDLAGRDLALFVDASTKAGAPFTFTAVAPARDPTFTSHAMSPAAVLAAYAGSFGEPPPAFVLAIRGESFELGEAMGEGARGNLRAAVAFYARLLDDPNRDVWAALASG